VVVGLAHVAAKGRVWWTISE